MSTPLTSTLFPYTTLFRSLYSAPKKEITALALDKEGNIYAAGVGEKDRKSTRLNSSHDQNSYAVFCLKKKRQQRRNPAPPVGVIKTLTRDTWIVNFVKASP